MEIENSKSPADRLREEHFTTKQDLLDWIDRELSRVSDQSKTDKKHTAAFYYVYTKLLRRFRQEIEKTVLFNRLEDFWYYSLSVSSAGATLYLDYTPKCRLDENGKLMVTYGQSLPIITVPGKYLSVEEYAAEYGVGAGTVRQWIRRGKIRTAKKAGKEWLIPELTEIPGRGYQPAMFYYNGHLRNQPEEFSYLDGHTAVIISQNPEEAGKFDICVTSRNPKTTVRLTLNTKEREKLELFLISHPDVLFIEGPDDGMNVSISTKEPTDDMVP